MAVNSTERQTTSKKWCWLCGDNVRERTRVHVPDMGIIWVCPGCLSSLQEKHGCGLTVYKSQQLSQDDVDRHLRDQLNENLRSIFG